MKRCVGYFLLLLLTACSGKNDLPSGVLEGKKMEEVMWDMIQADQYYREYLMRDTVGKDINQIRYNLYENIFKMHKISKATFDKSFDYYSSRPKTMKEIFDSLSVKGNRKLQDLYKPAIPENDSTIKGKLKPKVDSISAK
jgi:hypothetical protein